MSFGGTPTRRVRYVQGESDDMRDEIAYDGGEQKSVFALSVTLRVNYYYRRGTPTIISITVSSIYFIFFGDILLSIVGYRTDDGKT